MSGHDEQRALEQVIRRLTMKTSSPESEVRSTVEQCYAALDAAPIRDFVPVLVERAAIQALPRVDH